MFEFLHFWIFLELIIYLSGYNGYIAGMVATVNASFITSTRLSFNQAFLVDESYAKLFLEGETSESFQLKEII